jgi:hypothetical protein
MLGCLAMDVFSTYWTALEVIGSGCLSQGFLSGMGPLALLGSQKWSHEELVTDRASLCVRNELFSC